MWLGLLYCKKNESTFLQISFTCIYLWGTRVCGEYVSKWGGSKCDACAVLDERLLSGLSPAVTHQQPRKQKNKNYDSRFPSLLPCTGLISPPNTFASVAGHHNMTDPFFLTTVLQPHSWTSVILKLCCNYDGGWVLINNTSRQSLHTVPNSLSGRIVTDRHHSNGKITLCTQ